MVRMVVIASLLLVSFVAVRHTQALYQFEVAPPSYELSELPYEIGGWHGTDVELRDDTARVLNADSFISRIYRDKHGHEVSMHAALWATPDEVGEAAPHHPRVCYTAAGWETMGTADSADEAHSAMPPLEMCLFQKAGTQVVTGHWYQMGDQRFTTVAEGRRVLYGLLGKEVWPATLKVLIQADSNSIEEGAQTILPFAKQLSASLAEISQKSTTPL